MSSFAHAICCRRADGNSKHDTLVKNVLEKPIDQASGLAQAEERLKE